MPALTQTSSCSDCTGQNLTSLGGRAEPQEARPLLLLGPPFLESSAGNCADAACCVAKWLSLY